MKYLLSKYKILFIIFIPFFFFVMFITIPKTNYSVTTTGDITNLNTIISVENGAESKGSLNSVFVFSTDHSTRFQNWCGKLDKNAEVDKMGKNYSQFSTDELNKMGIIQKNQSIEASIITAYEYAMKDDASISIYYTFKGLIVRYIMISSDQLFKIGDIITEINGVSNASRDELANAYKTMVEGSIVKVLRGSEEITLTLNSASANYTENGALYGKALVYDKYVINNTTPKVKFSGINSQGPSAGLMQTLEIYNRLIESDITGGNRICGTGTIDTTRKVGAIGGVKEKIVAAYKNKAKLFLCPKANYEEALSQWNKLGNKNRMKLVSVSTFDETLEVLYGNI